MSVEERLRRAVGCRPNRGLPDLAIVMLLFCSCDGRVPADHITASQGHGPDAKENQDHSAEKSESYIPAGQAVEWVRSVTTRLAALLKTHAPGKVPREELSALRGEFQRAVRVSGDAMREVLRLAGEHRDVPGFVSEVEHATRPSGLGEMDFSLFDRALTGAVANLFLEEKTPQLKRLYLSLLLGHNRMIHDKPRIQLDEVTTGRVLSAGKAMKDEIAVGYVITLAGHYSEAYAGAREFISEVILDTNLRIDRRLEAIRVYSWGNPLSAHRIDLAKRLLESDRNRQIRRAAVDMLERFSAGPMDGTLETAAFELLRKAASRDSDPDVRSEAAGELLQRGDPKSVGCIADLLKAERDPVVRASMAHDLRYASGWWGPLDNHDGLYAAEELALALVDTDADENVRGNAMDSFVKLVDKTLIRTDDSGAASLDPRTLDAIQRAIDLIKKRSLPRQAKLKIKDHLENEFERKFPGLADRESYQDLKRRLDN